MSEFNDTTIMGSQLDLINRDSALVESLSSYDNTYSRLALESIGKRWGIRFTQSESFNVESMIETFLDWLVNISRKILDTINDCVGLGRRSLRKFKVLDDTFNDFKEATRKAKAKRPFIEDYAKYFVVNGKYNPKYIDSISRTLVKDTDELMRWSIKGIKEAANVLKITKSTSGRFDTIESINANDVAMNVTENLNVFIGDRVDRNLNSYSGKGDGEETQLLWALPGNSYLQYYKLYYHKDTEGLTKPIEGTRFLESDLSGVNPRELGGAEELLTFSQLRIEINSIRELALGLMEMETNNSKVQREIDELRRHVSFSKGKGKPISPEQRYAYRVARERLTTANVSVRSTVNTYRAILNGKIKRVEKHMEAYLGK